MEGEYSQITYVHIFPKKIKEYIATIILKICICFPTGLRKLRIGLQLQVSLDIDIIRLFILYKLTEMHRFFRFHGYDVVGRWTGLMPL